ncbi:Rho GTPase activation protein [Geopyxis carbonaria]|nr:Rho GTPase activation protein [Geopyxis carbonaria]
MFKLGLRKLCRSTYESLRKPESRQESYAKHLDEFAQAHEHLADNGMQFAQALYQMHEDLAELISLMERGRKHWKQFGLSSEKKVHDAEQFVEKIGVDKLLQAKIKYDSIAEEYERVRTGDRRSGKSFGFKGSKSGIQHEEELYKRLAAADSDYANKVQSAKYQRAELIHTLRPQAVNNLREMIYECDAGLTAQLQKYDERSLRQTINMVDNQEDFKSYILGLSSKMIESTPTDSLSINNNLQKFTENQTYRPPTPPIGANPPSSRAMKLTDIETKDHAQGFGAIIQQPVILPQASNASHAQRQSSQHSFPELPPIRPVFGVALDKLLARDDSAVPIIVYQCIQAVDLYGLDVEGIYRLSGEKRHVERIKAIFNNDFRRPEDFFHDVNGVASILKQFFRDLPDPLLTNKLYSGFIDAANIDDDVTRRDSLHALINQLPDPNYATLRILALHLNRVQEHSNVNRMNTGNLAICFGPTLMGSDAAPNIADAGWQARVIDSILQNCFSIFYP